MSEAARQNAFWSYKPGYKLTPEESDAFDYGWRAAMRFMAQPRIVSTPVHKEPDQVTQRFAQVECPECGGEGCIDSGAFDQQGYPINIGCPLCHGKPVTEAQVRAAGWVNANEKPQPKEHNPHGLVAFYTDAP